MQRLRTIDAHSGGMPLRLIVEGFPSPPGRTMAEKLGWVRQHADHIRQTLMLEPRGHADMYGAALTEPVSPGAHAGVIFMHGSGFADAFDHGIVALSTIAIEQGLIVPGGDGGHLVFDTVAGPVGARVVIGEGKLETGDLRVTSVSCAAPPSFVVRGGLTVRAGGRVLPVDLAYGGACYAVVDSEAAGLGLTTTHVPAIRRMGASILEAVGTVRFVHPIYDGIQGVHGVVFTGPASLPHADLRAVLMFGDGQIAASPTEAGSAAIVAVLDAIGLLADEGVLALDSLAGSMWSARIASRTSLGEIEAVVPEVQGSAWVTGDHTFTVLPDDPLVTGFRL